MTIQQEIVIAQIKGLDNLLKEELGKNNKDAFRISLIKEEIKKLDKKYYRL